MGIIEGFVLIIAFIAAGNVAKALKPRKVAHYENDIIVGVDKETGEQLVYYDKRVYQTQESLNHAIRSYKVYC